MMRQAGRYQKSYRELAKKHPSFRTRSETTELIVEISLQPWNSFRPDGVILFSDILTPFPALGVDFEIDDTKGPIIARPLKTMEDVNALTTLQLDKLEFVGRALGQLRQEVGSQAAVLGFVGSPWTLATYLIEGGSTSLYKNIKCMCHNAPEMLEAILSKLADAMTEYIKYQIRSGAHCIQIFDSWGGQLPPREWDRWSGPYLKRIVAGVKAEYPNVPLTLYANGSGGLLERIKTTGVDVVGIDWMVDMKDARTRLGGDVTLQGNVDPVILFGSDAAIEAAIRDVCEKAKIDGKGGRHILNLGHGVLVGTPEEGVSAMFDLSKRLLY
jgi:uroporphyrinogen decarboxylase